MLKIFNRYSLHHVLWCMRGHDFGKSSDISSHVKLWSTVNYNISTLIFKHRVLPSLIFKNFTELVSFSIQSISVFTEHHYWLIAYIDCRNTVYFLSVCKTNVSLNWTIMSNKLLNKFSIWFIGSNKDTYFNNVILFLISAFSGLVHISDVIFFTISAFSGHGSS